MGRSPKSTAWYAWPFQTWTLCACSRWPIRFPAFSLYLGKSQVKLLHISLLLHIYLCCLQCSRPSLPWVLHQPSVPAVTELLPPFIWPPCPSRTPLFSYMWVNTSTEDSALQMENTQSMSRGIWLFFITEFCSYHLCLHLSRLLDYKCPVGRDYEGFIFALPALSLQLCLQLKYK